MLKLYDCHEPVESDKYAETKNLYEYNSFSRNLKMYLLL